MLLPFLFWKENIVIFAIYGVDHVTVLGFSHTLKIPDQFGFTRFGSRLIWLLTIGENNLKFEIG